MAWNNLPEDIRLELCLDSYRYKRAVGEEKPNSRGRERVASRERSRRGSCGRKICSGSRNGEVAGDEGGGVVRSAYVSAISAVSAITWFRFCMFGMVLKGEGAVVHGRAAGG